MQSQPEIEIDASELLEEFFPDQQPIKIEVGAAPSESSGALTAALTAIAERIVQTEEQQQGILSVLQALTASAESERERLTEAVEALTAALSAQSEQVIHVTVPEIVVPEPVVNVTVPEPVVNVTVEAPVSRKKVDVTRDPVSGFIASATIEEVIEDGR